MTLLPSRGFLALRRALVLVAIAALPACAHSHAQTATATAGTCPAHGHHGGSCPAHEHGGSCAANEHGYGHEGPPPNPEEWIARRVAEMTEAVGLDETQQTEVRSALNDAHTQMEALKQAPGAPSPGHPPDQAWRDQAMQIHDRADDRIWAVLRCDQKDRMHAYERQQHRRFFEQHGRGHHGPGCGCGCGEPQAPAPTP